jgi:hypothetical protein
VAVWEATAVEPNPQTVIIRSNDPVRAFKNFMNQLLTMLRN